MFRCAGRAVHVLLQVRGLDHPRVSVLGTAFRGLKQQAVHDDSMQPVSPSAWMPMDNHVMPPPLDLTMETPFVACSSMETLMMFMSPSQLGAQVCQWCQHLLL